MCSSTSGKGDMRVLKTGNANMYILLPFLKCAKCAHAKQQTQFNVLMGSANRCMNLQMAQLQNRFPVSKYWDVFLFAESELESPHAVSTNGESGIGYRMQVGMCKVISHIGAEYV